MIRELDTIVLSRDIQEHGLKQGDTGTVVHCYQESRAFEVEFVTDEGCTRAVLTLTASDVAAADPVDSVSWLNKITRQYAAITDEEGLSLDEIYAQRKRKGRT